MVTNRIQLCGRLVVELHGQRLEDSLRGRQGRLLFAYLALNRDRPVRRDELAEALWSGKGAPPAYESLLAPPLSRLRKALGPGVLEGRSELQLVLPEDAWIDWEVAPARSAPAKAAADAARGGGRDRRARPAARPRGAVDRRQARRSSPTCASRRWRRWPHAGAQLGGAACPRPSRPPAPPSRPSRTGNRPAPR